MASGDKSGSKTFTTGFTPVEIVIYNDSPADIYYADGLFSTKPGATIRIPPNTDMPIPYTQNAQGFTLFWSSTSALTQSYQIIVKWSDVPLAVPYTPLTQQVSVANSVTISVTQSGSWNVSINNQPTVNVNGPVSVQGVSGGTAIGVSISSSVALNVQQSGNWTVSISNQPTVNVNGPVSVQGVSGGTAIGVSISSSVALNVQQSGTWTVDINTMPTVNINGPITVEGVSGGTAIGVQVQNDVTINGTVTVQFPSAQEVTLAATGPVNVTNGVVPSNSLVLINSGTSTITNLANGGVVSFFPESSDSLGLYDGIVIVFQTEAQADTAYSISPGTAAVYLPFVNSSVFSSGYARVYAGVTQQVNLEWSQDVYWQAQAVFMYDSPRAANNLGFSITNISGVTLSDTVNYAVWGIKAQISNQPGNPVQQQAASGEYAALEYTNGGSGAGPTGQSGSSSTTLTLLNSGGYAASLNWNAMSYTASVDAGTGVTAAFSLTLYFGGAMIATVSGNATINGNATITLPAGTWQPAKSVANSGVTVVAVMTVSGGTASGVSGTVNWGSVQMVEESVTPPVEVTSVA